MNYIKEIVPKYNNSQENMKLNSKPDIKIETNNSVSLPQNIIQEELGIINSYMEQTENSEIDIENTLNVTRNPQIDLQEGDQIVKTSNKSLQLIQLEDCTKIVESAESSKLLDAHKKEKQYEVHGAKYKQKLLKRKLTESQKENIMKGDLITKLESNLEFLRRFACMSTVLSAKEYIKSINQKCFNLEKSLLKYKNKFKKQKSLLRTMKEIIFSSMREKINTLNLSGTLEDNLGIILERFAENSENNEENMSSMIKMFVERHKRLKLENDELINEIEELKSKSKNVN